MKQPVKPIVKNIYSQIKVWPPPGLFSESTLKFLTNTIASQQGWPRMIKTTFATKIHNKNNIAKHKNSLVTLLACCFQIQLRTFVAVGWCGLLAMMRTNDV
jgi:hypothetical protein